MLVGLLLLTAPLWSQPLSNQVLQLLERTNTWEATQTFLDLRLSLPLPSVTTLRLYTDGTDLYWNGSAVTGGGSVTAPHNLLSTTHTDTLTASPVRGSVVVANSTPKWAAVARCASGEYIGSNGTDTLCRSDGSALTALNASNLGSGTVPLARITGLLDAQVDAAAAIAWSKISKTASSLADLATRSAADLSSGTLADARLSANVTLLGALISLATEVTGNLPVGNLNSGTSAGATTFWRGDGTWAVPAGTSTGTVSSVALALPAIFTISGSPVTTTGTLTGTLASQTANLVWAGPNTGAPAAPTFRALVNADFPTSGVVAATYPKVAVNAQGIVTSGTAQITLTTDVTGTLPFANGGTNLNTAGDDTTLVSGGSAWVATALGNCTTTPLGYTQATNLFSCLTTLSGLTSVSTTTLVVGSGGSNVTKIVTGTATWDPASVADGDAVTTTLTVTGAAVGQVCMAALSTLTGDTLLIGAFPSAADTVRAVINNNSGGAVDLASGTLRATCMAH